MDLKKGGRYQLKLRLGGKSGWGSSREELLENVQCFKPSLPFQEVLGVDAIRPVSSTNLFLAHKEKGPRQVKTWFTV